MSSWCQQCVCWLACVLQLLQNSEVIQTNDSLLLRTKTISTLLHPLCKPAPRRLVRVVDRSARRIVAGSRPASAGCLRSSGTRAARTAAARALVRCCCVPWAHGVWRLPGVWRPGARVSVCERATRKQGGRDGQGPARRCGCRGGRRGRAGVAAAKAVPWPRCSRAPAEHRRRCTALMSAEACLPGLNTDTTKQRAPRARAVSGAAAPPAATPHIPGARRAPRTPP